MFSKIVKIAINLNLLFMAFVIGGCSKVREVDTDDLGSFELSGMNKVCFQGPYIERETFKERTGLPINYFNFHNSMDGTILWLIDNNMEIKQVKLKNSYYEGDYRNLQDNQLCQVINNKSCLKFDNANHLFYIQSGGC